MRQDDWLTGLGALLADRSRSAMLLHLMDGRAYTATELARAANVTAPTASHHLERLETAGVVARVRQGRHSYFRIADDSVAAFIEQALATHAGLTADRIPNSCPQHLRNARLCYDHLAGVFGVRMLTAGLKNHAFILNGEHVTADGAVFAALGIAAEDLAGRFCMDWSERRFHLAGPLAAAITQAMLSQRWLLAGKQRELTVTEKGLREFERWFPAE